MYDMNFFSYYKRSQAKNKSFIAFILVFLVVVVLLNAVLIGGGLYLYNSIESDIQSMRNYISDPATQKAVEEAEKIRSEAELTAKYLSLLNTVDNKLDQMDHINSELLLSISLLTPESVSFRSAQINGISVLLICESRTPTGPMDMYHALVKSPLFANVVMSGIAIGDTGCSFSISFVIVQEGGEQS